MLELFIIPQAEKELAFLYYISHITRSEVFENLVSMLIEQMHLNKKYWIYG